MGVSRGPLWLNFCGRIRAVFEGARHGPTAGSYLPLARPALRDPFPKFVICPQRTPSRPAKPQELPMPTLKLDFLPFSARPAGVLIVFCDNGLKFGSAARAVLEPAGDLIKRAAEAEGFKAKHGSALEIVAPSGLDVPRLVVVGVGKV